MADKKISALTSATTPLAGTEVLPIVQSSTTVKVAVSDLTAGRAVSALSYTSTTGATFSTSSGNVGVGVASPAAKLDVSANAVIMGYFRSSGGSANDQRLTFTSGGGRVVLDAATNSTGASSAFGFTLGGAEGARLTTTGLGIFNTSPTNALSVTGSANFSGIVGIGGATTSSVGVYVTNSALSSTNQFGVLSAPTGTSAATVYVAAFGSVPATANATFTATDVMGFRASNATKGAASTITNLHGVYIVDQTSGTNNYGITSLVSSGSNKWNVYASGTASNYFAGTVSIGTTSPSASALLDVQSTTKGVRMPNMTTTQKNAIATPAAGLMVFDTTLAKLCVYSGAAWETITSI